MNRIKKIDNNYQVLITPYNSVEAESEYLLSQWTNNDVDNYNILYFNTFVNAYKEACKYPNINWKFFYLYYKDQFYFIRDNIVNTLETFKIYNDYSERLLLSEYKIKLDYYLMDEETIKYNFFSRVDKKRKKFRPLDDFSDILSFKLICKNNDQLLILKKYFQP